MECCRLGLFDIAAAKIGILKCETSDAEIAEILDTEAENQMIVALEKRGYTVIKTVDDECIDDKKIGSNTSMADQSTDVLDPIKNSTTNTLPYSDPDCQVLHSIDDVRMYYEMDIIRHDRPDWISYVDFVEKLILDTLCATKQSFKINGLFVSRALGIRA